MRNVYADFLSLCNIVGEEQKELLPDWIEACKRFKLTEEDVRYAVDEWIPSTIQINYNGMRTVMGAYIREIIQISKLPELKASGVKVVYGVLPAVVQTYSALKKAGGDNVFVTFPDLAVMTVIQCFFNKGGNFFEIAEQAGMTYGARHCALNKMRIGIRLADVVPTPDVAWSWGMVCDEATKVDEYIQNMYDESWTSVIARLPHDTARTEHGYDDPDRIRFVANELRHSMGEVMKITGIEVGPEHMDAANQEFFQLLMTGTQLMDLNFQADPQPLSGTTMLLACGMPLALPFNTGLDNFLAGVHELIEECQRDIAAGIGMLPKGSPKVGMYFIPWALPWLDKLFRDNGVVPTFSTATGTSMRQMAPSNFEEPFEMVAESWLRSAFTLGCQPEIDDWIEKINRYHPDAFLAGFLDYDRWIGALHKKMCKEVEAQTGVPCFYMEADFYDDRDYSNAALETRVESICQIIRAQKAEKNKQ